MHDDSLLTFKPGRDAQGGVAAENWKQGRKGVGGGGRPGRSTVCGARAQLPLQNTQPVGPKRGSLQNKSRPECGVQN